MVENFLELGCGCAALASRQIRFATHVNGKESDANYTRRSELVGGCRGECFNRLGGAAAWESSSRVDHGQIFELYNSVLQEAFGQVVGQPCGLSLDSARSRVRIDCEIVGGGLQGWIKIHTIDTASHRDAEPAAAASGTTPNPVASREGRDASGS